MFARTVFAKRPSLFAAALVGVSLIAPAVAQDAPPDDGAAAEAPKHAFRVKLEKGQKVAFKNAMELEQDLNMGGMDMPMRMKVTTVATYEVKDVADTGEISLDLTFGRVNGSFSHPMAGQIAFDSDAPGGNPMEAAFTVNSGETVSVRIAPTGEVLEVSGPGVESIMKKTLATNPMAQANGPLTVEKVAQQLGDDFEQYLAVVPTDEVAVGDSWKTERSISGLGGLDVQLALESTLASMSDDEVVVDSSIEGKVAGGASAAMVEVSEFTGTGATRISPKDGLPLRTESRVTMTGSINSPQGQGDLELRINRVVERMQTPATAAETPSGGSGDSGSSDGDAPAEK